MIAAALSLLLCIPAFAGNDSETKKEVKYNENGEIIKTGINYGPLPVVAFDADRGFQFGALLNLYNFGDGKNYPNPNSQWYFEASAYTKEPSNGGAWLRPAPRRSRGASCYRACPYTPRCCSRSCAANARNFRRPKRRIEALSFRENRCPLRAYQRQG